MPHATRLQLIKSFVAVATSGNIKRTSELLGITQSAVSKQILQLEEELKVKLFRRTARGVELTEAGALIFPDCERGVKLIEGALDRVATGTKTATLIVACARSFATRIISRFIGEFCRSNPWISVRIDGYRHLSDLRRGEADVGIRVGEGEWRDVIVERLCVDPLLPVCSPALRSQLAISSPDDLLRDPFILLRFSDRPYWRNWAQHYGLIHNAPARGPLFSETVMMLEAAEAGQGIALGRASLVRNALNNGHLVLAAPYSFDDGVAYYYVANEMTLNRRPNRIFREWIFDRVVPEMIVEIDG